MFCRKCGKELKDDALYCVNCGEPTRNYQQFYNQHPNSGPQPMVALKTQPTVADKNIDASSQSKLTAALLAIFLGRFGAHNFYTKNYLKAILQLVISIIGIIIETVSLVLETYQYTPHTIVTISVIGDIFTAVSSIWALVEFIIILSNKYKSKVDNKLIKRA